MYALEGIHVAVQEGEPALVADMAERIERLITAVQTPGPASSPVDLLTQLQDDHTLVCDTLKHATLSLGRALRITDQILQYGEVVHLQPGDNQTPAATVVQNLLKEREPELRLLGIVCTVDIPDTLQLPIRAEHARAILGHLLSNACDAVRGKPTRTVMIRGKIDNAAVVVAVQDSGMGLTPETRARLFEPFFSTKGTAGMGLGLGLSRKLAQVYGGDIECDAKVEQGAVFSLTLPNAGTT